MWQLVFPLAMFVVGVMVGLSMGFLFGISLSFDKGMKNDAKIDELRSDHQASA